TDFGKRPLLLTPIDKPPYYATKLGVSLLAVMGGLKIDKHMRVLDANGVSIPGLYAVGNVSGGMYAVDYPLVIPGNSHGRALTWGYLASTDAAQRE
ncbi:MAG: FAD-binding protein, partial [Eubacteriales bacterium]|nr:FAD-binding protein [Eubacteriales bacterium]